MIFRQAKPVWQQGQQKEWTITLGFYAKVNKPAEQTVLRVATSGFYRVFVNGKFAYYGPIRCAQGHYRADEVPLTEYMTEAKNHIAVEVVNYYVKSFYSLMQPGFIQLEVENDGVIVAATDEKPLGFAAYRLNQRVRNVQRYTIQRTFVEDYRLRPDTDAWRVGETSPDAEACTLELTEEKVMLPRELPLHTFPTVEPSEVIAHGDLTINPPLENPYRDRALDNSRYAGYAIEDMDIVHSDEVQRFAYTQTSGKRAYDGKTALTEGSYEVFRLPRECTGFTAMDIHCDKAADVYMLYDEQLTDGVVDALRMKCTNVIRLQLQPGDYHFMNIEPMGYLYFSLVCVSGEVTVSNIHMLEYVHPLARTIESPSEDADELMMFEAAWHTFRQNAADLFTDCPTRERAGWLCDSFFIGRAAQFFTNDALMEKQFLENFILPDKFGDELPDGMVPKCYPSDNFGSFILNWALWYVAELEDYTRRSGDTDLAARSKDLVYRMLRYLKTIENEDGLLDHLPSWAFVEWSKANDLVQDINFPNNMVYAYMLRATGKMYDDDSLIEKSEALKNTILERSFNGEFFVDNEVYNDDGVPVSTGETTETCQYHAFFFGIATPESHPELWQKLITDFGPQREKTGLYPKVYPSNAFTGNLLRLDILLRYGLYDQCRREVLGYYTDMARQTGTLWEHMNGEASCNHGFAAYAANLLYYSIKKEEPPFKLNL